MEECRGGWVFFWPGMGTPSSRPPDQGGFGPRYRGRMREAAFSAPTRLRGSLEACALRSDCPRGTPIWRAAQFVCGSCHEVFYRAKRYKTCEHVDHDARENMRIHLLIDF